MGKLNFRLQEARKALEKPPVENRRIRESGETNAWILIGGQRKFRITVPQGRGEVKIGTAKSIYNQFKLNDEDCMAFIKCSMSGKEYVAFIEKKLLRAKYKSALVHES